MRKQLNSNKGCIEMNIVIRFRDLEKLNSNKGCIEIKEPQKNILPSVLLNSNKGCIEICLNMVEYTLKHC